MRLGVDISNNNGIVDLSYCSFVGVSVVAIKAQEGISFRDDFFVRNVDHARACGLYPGGYDFGRPSKGSGAQDAQAYLNGIRGVAGLAFHVLDLEDEEVPTGSGLAAYALDWFEHVASERNEPKYLYVSHTYALNHGLMDEPDLSQFKLWLASWSLTKPKSFGPWSQVDAWQYTCEGFVPGIGVVDQSIWYTFPD